MLNGGPITDCMEEGLLYDIMFLSQLLQAVMFSFAPRTCNRGAHAVASFVSRRRGCCFWDFLDMPEWLFDILASDVNLSIRL